MIPSEPSPEYNFVSWVKMRFVELLKNSGKGAKAGRVRREERNVLVGLKKGYSKDKVAGLLKKVESETELVIKGYRELGYEVVVDARFKLRTRLLVGVGDPYTSRVFNVGISWHPYYNIPYIPSSSLRGALRAASKYKGVCVEDFGKAGDGGAGEASSIVVLDSYPVDCDSHLLDVDIITPHYREPEGRVSEVEARPTPIPFLTVSPGTVFRFVILGSARGGPGCGREEVYNLLKFALKNGLGAKTSLAYGRFRVEE